jgi:putative transposase
MVIPAVTCLNSVPEAERNRAMDRFRILQPFLEEEMALTQVARQQGLALRTAQRWVMQYRQHGLAGLCRMEYVGKGQHRLSSDLQQAIEGLALQKPKLSVAAVHRQAGLLAGQRGEPVPGYATVYRLVRRLEPALVTLAHEGTKVYSESFDLVHRTEAEAPNAIWQADHTELDILVKYDRGQPRKPWLTIVLDDYSRAVAGYFLSLSAPSAIQTALALRQAVWRKAHPGWHICGIPQILYTDHGSYTTLDVPGSTYTVPYGINNSGQIVGAYGEGTSGNTVGPSPSTKLFFGF